MSILGVCTAIGNVQAAQAPFYSVRLGRLGWVCGSSRKEEMGWCLGAFYPQLPSCPCTHGQNIRYLARMDITSDACGSLASCRVRLNSRLWRCLTPQRLTQRRRQIIRYDPSKVDYKSAYHSLRIIRHDAEAMVHQKLIQHFLAGHSLSSSCSLALFFLSLSLFRSRSRPPSSISQLTNHTILFIKS